MAPDRHATGQPPDQLDLPAEVPAWAAAFAGPQPDHTTNYDDRHWSDNDDSGGGSSALGFGGSR